MKIYYRTKFNMTKYFENRIVRLQVFYVPNKHVKFHSNWMLFTIKFINLFFMHKFKLLKNLKLKYWIDNIFIDFWSFWKFSYYSYFCTFGWFLCTKKVFLLSYIFINKVILPPPPPYTQTKVLHSLVKKSIFYNTV